MSYTSVSLSIALGVLSVIRGNKIMSKAVWIVRYSRGVTYDDLPIKHLLISVIREIRGKNNRPNSCADCGA